MPFTPFHMGPGLLTKSILHSAFSLMVFGWTQIVMDLQPLFVLLTGEGHLHGFSHTFVGGALIACFCAITGKYLTPWALKQVPGHERLPFRVYVSWPVAILSACIGAISHVLLDAIMHSDVQPFFPFSLSNPWLLWVDVGLLHKLCLYSGLVGAFLYVLVAAWSHRRTSANF